MHKYTKNAKSRVALMLAFVMTFSSVPFSTIAFADDVDITTSSNEEESSWNDEVEEDTVEEPVYEETNDSETYEEDPTYEETNDSETEEEPTYKETNYNETEEELTYEETNYNEIEEEPTYEETNDNETEEEPTYEETNDNETDTEDPTYEETDYESETYEEETNDNHIEGILATFAVENIPLMDRVVVDVTYVEGLVTAHNQRGITPFRVNSITLLDFYTGFTPYTPVRFYFLRNGTRINGQEVHYNLDMLGINPDDPFSLGSIYSWSRNVSFQSPGNSTQEPIYIYYELHVYIGNIRVYESNNPLRVISEPNTSANTTEIIYVEPVERFSVIFNTPDVVYVYNRDRNRTVINASFQLLLDDYDVSDLEIYHFIRSVSSTWFRDGVSQGGGGSHVRSTLSNRQINLVDRFYSTNYSSIFPVQTVTEVLEGYWTLRVSMQGTVLGESEPIRVNVLEPQINHDLISVEWNNYFTHLQAIEGEFVTLDFDPLSFYLVLDENTGLSSFSSIQWYWREENSGVMRGQHISNLSASAVGVNPNNEGGLRTLIRPAWFLSVSNNLWEVYYLDTGSWVFHLYVDGHLVDISDPFVVNVFPDPSMAAIRVTFNTNDEQWPEVTFVEREYIGDFNPIPSLDIDLSVFNPNSGLQPNTWVSIVWSSYDNVRHYLYNTTLGSIGINPNDPNSLSGSVDIEYPLLSYWASRELAGEHTLYVYINGRAIASESVNIRIVDYSLNHVTVEFNDVIDETSYILYSHMYDLDPIPSISINLGDFNPYTMLYTGTEVEIVWDIENYGAFPESKTLGDLGIDPSDPYQLYALNIPVPHPLKDEYAWPIVAGEHTLRVYISGVLINSQTVRLHILNELPEDIAESIEVSFKYYQLHRHFLEMSSWGTFNPIPEITISLNNVVPNSLLRESTPVSIVWNIPSIGEWHILTDTLGGIGIVPNDIEYLQSNVDTYHPLIGYYAFPEVYGDHVISVYIAGRLISSQTVLIKIHGFVPDEESESESEEPENLEIVTEDEDSEEPQDLESDDESKLDESDSEESQDSNSSQPEIPQMPVPTIPTPPATPAPSTPAPLPLPPNQQQPEDNSNQTSYYVSHVPSLEEQRVNQAATGRKNGAEVRRQLDEGVETVELPLEEGVSDIILFGSALQAMINEGVSLEVITPNGTAIILTPSLMQEMLDRSAPLSTSGTFVLSLTDLESLESRRGSYKPYSSFEFNVAINGATIARFENPIKARIQLNSPSPYINPWRMTAVNIHGQAIGGNMNLDTMIFTFETHYTGSFTLEYVSDLTRLLISLYSNEVIDLAQPDRIISTMDMLPVVYNDYIFVSLPFISYALGIDTDWEQVQLYDEESENIDMLKIVDDVTMVSIEFVSEFFGIHVNWNSYRGEIEIIR